MIDLYKMIISILIGTIEGITEFLPISSTGHIIITSHWLGIENDKNAQILNIFIQFGSACAILYFFQKKLIKMIRSNISIKNNQTNIIHIFFSIFPTIFLGSVFYKKIKLLNIDYIIYALILGSFYLIVSEIFKPINYKTSSLQKINLIQSIIIGLFQIFCLCPGFSRSGMTIGTGILLGIKKSVAIDFSFIISIPLLIGASFYDLINHFYEITILALPMFVIGFIVSFTVSIICIKKLLQIMNRTSLILFAIYRIIIAILIYFIH